MSPLTPALPPIQNAPPQAAQTPQSQYLAAALKAMSAAQPSTTTGLAEGLGAQGMAQYAQHRALAPGQAQLANSLSGVGPMGSPSGPAALSGGGNGMWGSFGHPGGQPGGLIGMGMGGGRGW